MIKMIKYLEGILKNITSEYHYHTVSAPSEKLLDLIQEKLQEKGFLAGALLPYTKTTL